MILHIANLSKLRVETHEVAEVNISLYGGCKLTYSNGTTKVYASDYRVFIDVEDAIEEIRSEVTKQVAIHQAKVNFYQRSKPHDKRLGHHQLIVDTLKNLDYTSK